MTEVEKLRALLAVLVFGGEVNAVYLDVPEAALVEVREHVGRAARPVLPVLRLDLLDGKPLRVCRPAGGRRPSVARSGACRARGCRRSR